MALKRSVLVDLGTIPWLRVEVDVGAGAKAHHVRDNGCNHLQPGHAAIQAEVRLHQQVVGLGEVDSVRASAAARRHHNPEHCIRLVQRGVADDQQRSFRTEHTAEQPSVPRNRCALPRAVPDVVSRQIGGLTQPLPRYNTCAVFWLLLLPAGRRWRSRLGTSG